MLHLSYQTKQLIKILAFNKFIDNPYPSKTFSLRSALDSNICTYWLHLLQGYIKKWPEYSGDMFIPIPINCKEERRDECYEAARERDVLYSVKSPYGKAHRRLIAFITQELAKEDKLVAALLRETDSFDELKLYIEKCIQASYTTKSIVTNKITTTKLLPHRIGLGAYLLDTFELSGALLRTIIGEWPNKTADAVYPVPHPTLHPREAYITTENKYIGEYGKARLELLDFITAHLLKLHAEILKYEE